MTTVREALRVLVDPELPWIHEEGNHNCGECWECIYGTLSIARIFRVEGLRAENPDLWGYETARTMEASKMAEYQHRAIRAEAALELLEKELTAARRGRHSVRSDAIQRVLDYSKGRVNE